MKLPTKAADFLQYIRLVLCRAWASRKADYEHVYSQDGNVEKTRYQKARKQARNIKKISPIGRRSPGQTQLSGNGVTVSWAVSQPALHPDHMTVN
jgi:hypothetical protein